GQFQQCQESLTIIVRSVQDESTKSTVRSIHARSGTVWLQFSSRVVLTVKECFRYGCNSAHITKLAHEVRNRGPTQHVIGHPHPMKLFERGGPATRILSKFLNCRELVVKSLAVLRVALLRSTNQGNRLQQDREIQQEFSHA